MIPFEIALTKKVEKNLYLFYTIVKIVIQILFDPPSTVHPSILLLFIVLKIVYEKTQICCMLPYVGLCHASVISGVTCACIRYAMAMLWKLCHVLFAAYYQ